MVAKPRRVGDVQLRGRGVAFGDYARRTSSNVLQRTSAITQLTCRVQGGESIWSQNRGGVGDVQLRGRGAAFGDSARGATSNELQGFCAITQLTFRAQGGESIWSHNRGGVGIVQVQGRGAASEVSARGTSSNEIRRPVTATQSSCRVQGGESIWSQNRGAWAMFNCEVVGQPLGTVREAQQAMRYKDLRRSLS